MTTYSSYEIFEDKNSYHGVLEMAGATVHAFQDFGSYQGDWLAKVTYNGVTGWIKDSYGSCSGCDSFESESGYEQRTKNEWKEFSIKFCKDYLEDIRTYEDMLKMCSENLDWDMEAKDMIKFLEENK